MTSIRVVCAFFALVVVFSPCSAVSSERCFDLGVKAIERLVAKRYPQLDCSIPDVEATLENFCFRTTATPPCENKSSKKCRKIVNGKATKKLANVCVCESECCSDDDCLKKEFCGSLGTCDRCEKTNGEFSPVACVEVGADFPDTCYIESDEGDSCFLG